MFKSTIWVALVVAGLTGSAMSPAQATLVNYNLTFADPDGAGPLTGGNGVLQLNLPGGPLGSGFTQIFPGSGAPNSGTLPTSDFVSLTATVDNIKFVFSSVGNSDGQIASLQFNNGLLTDIETAGAGALTSNQHLQIHGGNFYQVQAYPGNGVNFTGFFSVASPVVSAVPESSTWAMFLLGFAGIGFLAYRRRKQDSMILVSMA